jgi:hypothetical protein
MKGSLEREVTHEIDAGQRPAVQMDVAQVRGRPAAPDGLPIKAPRRHARLNHQRPSRGQGGLNVRSCRGEDGRTGTSGSLPALGAAGVPRVTPTDGEPGDSAQICRIRSAPWRMPRLPSSNDDPSHAQAAHHLRRCGCWRHCSHPVRGSDRVDGAENRRPRGRPDVVRLGTTTGRRRRRRTRRPPCPPQPLPRTAQGSLRHERPVRRAARSYR